MGTLAQYTNSNMKFLVLSALVAVSSAQLVAYHNGAVVPADTPSVAAAKLAHANAGGVVNLEGVLAHGYAAGYPYGYAGYFGGLVGHANGAVVPVDEPAVVAAKAAHAAAGGAIHAPCLCWICCWIPLWIRCRIPFRLCWISLWSPCPRWFRWSRCSPQWCRGSC